MTQVPILADGEEGSLPVYLQTYNLLKAAEYPIPDNLLRRIRDIIFSVDGTLNQEIYLSTFREVVDPISFKESLCTFMGNEENKAKNMNLDALATHDWARQKAQALRKRDWIKKLKTPLATIPNQSRYGTTKILSFFTCLLKNDLASQSSDIEKAKLLLWTLIDEFQLSYFIVIDSLVKFVEDILSHKCETAGSKPQVNASLLMNNVRKIIPHLEKTLEDIIQTRVKLYSSMTVSHSDIDFLRSIIATSMSTLSHDDQQRMIDRISYYFVPEIPYRFTSAVGLFIEMELISLDWYLGILGSSTFMKEVERNTSFDPSAYIPYWFYHAVVYQNYRLCLAKRKKTAIHLEGSKAGTLSLAETDGKDDYILYLLFSPHSASNSLYDGDKTTIPAFLGANPFIDLLCALLRTCTIYDACYQPASVLLEWLERCVEAAKDRLHTEPVVTKEAGEVTNEKRKDFRMLPLRKAHNFYEFTRSQESFSVFDHAPSLDARKLSVVACDFLLGQLKKSGSHETLLNAASLLYRLKHRIAKNPLLVNKIMTVDAFRNNYAILMQCIIPALTILGAKSEFSKLRVANFGLSEYFPYWADVVFSCHNAIIELYHPEVHKKLLAEGEKPHVIDPLIRAVDQMNHELIHYKLIRLVPSSVAETRLFMSPILLSSPSLVMNILIEQAIKKPNQQLMVQQSKLLILSENDKASAEWGSWTSFLSMNKKRFQLLIILSFNIAKKREGGISSLEQKQNEIFSIASFCFITCRSIIHDILNRWSKLNPTSPQRAAILKAQTFDVIRGFFSFTFSRILCDKSYRITAIMFLKSFAEHVLFQSCISETGIVSEVKHTNSSESVDHITSLLTLSMTGLSNLSVVHWTRQGQRDRRVLSCLENTFSQRFALGRLVQWFTKTVGGYSLFVANQSDEGLMLSHQILVHFLFLESGYDIHLVQSCTGGSPKKYCRRIHTLLTDAKTHLIDTFTDEANESMESKDLLLSRLRRLMDICSDLQGIYTDDEPFIQRTMVKFAETSNPFAIATYDVCYSAHTYEDMKDTLRTYQKAEPIGISLNNLEDVFFTVQKTGMSDSYAVGIMILSIDLLKQYHEKDCKAYFYNYITSIEGVPREKVLPSTNQLLNALKSSIQKSYGIALYVALVFGYRHIDNSAILPAENAERMSALRDSIQHYVNEAFSMIILTLPSLSSGECMNAGTFINTILTMMQRSMQYGCTVTREIYRKSIEVIEGHLLYVLKMANQTQCEAGVNDGDISNSLIPKQSNNIPLYLLQNSLSILWEIRFHLGQQFSGEMHKYVSDYQGFMFEDIDLLENHVGHVLKKLLSSTLVNEDVGIIKPQVMALMKWVQARSTTNTTNSHALKREREDAVIPEDSIEADVIQNEEM